MRKTPLTLKIVTSFVLLSLVITIVTTAAQIFNLYLQEQKAFTSNLNQIEKIYKKSVSEALWNMNIEQLKVQLNSLSSIPGVQSSEVRDTNNGIVASAIISLNSSNLKEKQKEIKIVPLAKEDEVEMTPLGSLVVYLDKSYINDKIYNDLISIILIQTFRNLLITFVFYFFINRIIANPLGNLFSQIPTFSSMQEHKKISIKREKHFLYYLNYPDEINDLEDAINNLHSNAVNSYMDLTVLNAELEDRVSAKTRLILEQRELLEQSAKLSSLGEMAAGIAHEINNPLTVIQGKVSVLKKTKTSMVKEEHYERFEKELTAIERNVFRIAHIVKSLKAISRNSNLDPLVDTSMRSVLEDALTICHEKIHFNDIKLEIEERVMTKVIQCHPGEIIQIFLNLLSNSVDAIADLEDKWIKISLEGEDDTTYTFSVIDSGKAIPKELHEKIFEPFFTTKDPGKGTGIGLSISAKIIQNNKGKLTYDKDSAHAKFNVTLFKAGVA